MNREQVVALVKEHLNRVPVQHRYGIHVVVEGITQDGDWWTVPVGADEEPKRRWQYYELLASIESDIFDETQLNILLVPVS